MKVRVIRNFRLRHNISLREIAEAADKSIQWVRVYPIIGETPNCTVFFRQPSLKTLVNREIDCGFSPRLAKKYRILGHSGNYRIDPNQVELGNAADTTQNRYTIQLALQCIIHERKQRLNHLEAEHSVMKRRFLRRKWNGQAHSRRSGAYG